MSNDVFVATESFSTEINGETFVVHRDKTRVREGHPILKANPDYFEPAGDGVMLDVEHATAAPGEKRRTRTKTAAPGEKPGSDPSE
jgi:hypothetical protein